MDRETGEQSRKGRHSGESRNPGRNIDFKSILKSWIPAFAGMTNGIGCFLLLIALLLSSCGYSFKRESIKDGVKDMAQRAYHLDVEVAEVGETLGIQFEVKNMLGEMVAEDQLFWKNLDDLRMALTRVALSTDRPPEFIVWDVVDTENPALRLLSTQYVKDIQKAWADGYSRSQFMDRLVMELIIGDKKIVFDTGDFDLIRFLLLGMDSLSQAPADRPAFELKEVEFNDFLAKVTGNTLRRLFREKDEFKKAYQLRDVKADFMSDDRNLDHFEVLLDLIALAGTRIDPDFIERKILPFLAEQASLVLKSYRFSQFQDITVKDRNTGQIFVLGTGSQGVTFRPVGVPK